MMKRTRHLLLLTALLLSASLLGGTASEEKKPHDWLPISDRVKMAEIIVIGRLSDTTRTHFANSAVVVKTVLKGDVGGNPMKVGYFYSEVTTDSDAPWKQDHILFLHTWHVEEPRGILWTKFVGRTVLDDLDGPVGIVSRDYNGLLPATDESVGLVKRLLAETKKPNRLAGD